MSVSHNLIIGGILLLPGYPHTYSCADIQSLSILISTNSTAWDHAAAFKSTTVAFFVHLKLPMSFLLHLSVMDETIKSLSERITKKYGNSKICHLLGSGGSALIWLFIAPWRPYLVRV